MSNKLYQKLTPEEIISELEKFIYYYRNTQNKIPLCLQAAIEYIFLHEEGEKNE